MSAPLPAVDLNQVLDWGSAAATVLLVVALGVSAVIGIKCKSCGTRKSLAPTGETRPVRALGVKHDELWRCGSCGTTAWVRKLRWWLWLP
jgi:hypothetical protein